jgi:hypothetical protein
MSDNNIRRSDARKAAKGNGGESQLVVLCWRTGVGPRAAKWDKFMQQEQLALAQPRLIISTPKGPGRMGRSSQQRVSARANRKGHRIS